MTQDVPQPAIKIIKVGNCNTLSGNGNLGYQIGCNDNSEIFLRITSNSGSGWFSADWVSLKLIMSALGVADKTLTSYALYSLFKGKSVNTPAFLFAALKNEGLIVVDPDNPRCYVAVSPDSFMGEIKALITAGTDLKPDSAATVKSATKNPSVKKLKFKA